MFLQVLVRQFSPVRLLLVAAYSSRRARCGSLAKPAQATLPDGAGVPATAAVVIIADECNVAEALSLATAVARPAGTEAARALLQKMNSCCRSGHSFDHRSSWTECRCSVARRLVARPGNFPNRCWGDRSVFFRRRLQSVLPALHFPACARRRAGEMEKANTTKTTAPKAQKAGLRISSFPFLPLGRVVQLNPLRKE